MRLIDADALYEAFERTARCWPSSTAQKRPKKGVTPVHKSDDRERKLKGGHADEA